MNVREEGSFWALLADFVLLRLWASRVFFSSSHLLCLVFRHFGGGAPHSRRLVFNIWSSISYFSNMKGFLLLNLLFYLGGRRDLQHHQACYMWRHKKGEFG
mgnify:CR=1 FL=1